MPSLNFQWISQLNLLYLEMKEKKNKNIQSIWCNIYWCGEQMKFLIKNSQDRMISYYKPLKAENKMSE